MLDGRLTKVKSRLFLDIVVGEGATILKLLSGEDEALLVGGNTLLVLNLGFNVVDGIGGLDLEGDGLSRQGLDKDLHPTTEAEDQVEGRLLLDVAAELSIPRSVRAEGKELTSHSRYDRPRVAFQRR